MAEEKSLFIEDFCPRTRIHIHLSYNIVGISGQKESNGNAFENTGNYFEFYQVLDAWVLPLAYVTFFGNCPGDRVEIIFPFPLLPN